MTIREAAQYLGCKPKLLIDELTKRYPDQNWTLDSHLPEEFIEEIENRVKAHQQAQQPHPKANLAKADPQNAIEAIQDAVATEKAFRQAIIESLDIVEQQEFIVRGVQKAFRAVETMDAAANATLDAIINSRIQSSQETTATIQNEIDEMLKAIANQKSEQLGKVVRVKQQQQEELQKTQDYLNSLLTAINPINA